MKDKISFIVAFLGVVVALAPFKDSLQNIPVNMGLYSPSLLELIYLSLALLFLSTYLYAVDYIRYGFKALDSFKIFKYIQIAGDTLYLLAVVSPIIYLSTWLVVKVAILIPSTTAAFKVSSQLTSTLVSVISLVFTVYASWIQNKEMKKVKEQLLEDSSLTAENEAMALIEKNQWNLAIIEAFRSVELAINKNLVDLGIEPSRMPMARGLDLLIKQGIITKDDYNKIQYIRELRNKAAHSTIEHSKDEALEVMNIVKEIVPKIDTAGSSYYNFEKKALSALAGGNGLFVKHHFLENMVLFNLVLTLGQKDLILSI